MVISEERMKALQDAIKKIEKDFGKGSIMRLGDRADTKIDAISSGSILIDSALGIGGFPRGRIIEIYGPESSGKTTTALHVVAEVQKTGGVAAYIDAEHAMDPLYAKNLGIDIDDLFLSQPDSGEEALEIAEALISSGAIDVIVIDSVAALVPKAEIKGDMGDSHVGLQARLMSQALRKLSSVINKQKTVAIFINQLREKVGVTYGNPEVTPGGRALKFYSTIRMEVRKSEAIKGSKDSEIIGNSTKIKIVKNKVAPPFKTVYVDIMYGEGISKTGEILDLAVEHDMIKKSGSWYSYGEDRIGQGRETAKKFLLEHPEIMAEVDRKLRIKMGLIEPTAEESALLNKDISTEQEETVDITDPLLVELLEEE
ncbi:recombinase RecA [Granulicatella sp. zg-ZJ]|uniref:recombinase RecA n=1 Tax=unclassified Granulicatella TaxID=2630493 RepID=UPI0013C12DE6|nr:MULTISPECIES: recombinase RecA [unclassified Granulicatella]MBS4749560.1 recombinase RecA [Carnobacteriaceae bacterium zg-ZUI78]QMI86496.1 recombinase RecA [Carnobacteriaceae bacterium zg-84]NEW62458.1 recombinase RecA [Granulicatella sp. zg-ZJ]NEW63004.1 recombinase RecA [Granulicatella sp. zg-ZJ]NEW65752.1 recombinase RecA [Granulicatella sp. zg-84]